MANTIIQLKNSGIPGNVPSILQPGELAINYTDGKLFYGNSLNVAVLFGGGDVAEPSGLNGEIQFNDSGVFGASANLKFDSSTNTLTVDEIASQTTGRIFNHANGAFSTANTKLDATGGTISGDLIISGNLTITGNSVSHSTNDFIVNDPIILLANNNPGNILDIGFVAHYEDGSANTKHTGLVRDVSAGVWYLFDDYIPHIQEDNLLNVADPSFRVSTLTANLVTDAITVRGVDPLDRANAAYSTANTKFDSTGGTISGNIAVTGIVTINTHAVLESTEITTASISQTTLDAFATATYRSAKYLVQMTSGSAYHMIELSLIHDGTTVHLSQYGEVKTGSSLGSFDASISSGTLSVLFTPTNSTTTVKATATLLPV
jgi:hypothetical protein